VGRKSGDTSDSRFSDSVLATWITGSVITNAAQQSVHSAGTLYNLTATSALIDFGTTDPTLTLSGTGTYRITARAVLDYNGATFAAVRTATIKLRRTNNTAADLTNGSVAVKTQIVTTVTGTLAAVTIDVIYTTSGAGDIIQLWGGLDVVPTAGNLEVASASIIAQRLQQ
jgi:hypothetical protein